MEQTAKEALLLALPEKDKVKFFNNPIRVFTESFKAVLPANRKAGCIEMEIVNETDSDIQFDVTYCVWLELSNF